MKKKCLSKKILECEESTTAPFLSSGSALIPQRVSVALRSAAGD